jgi:hypothetical protein
MRIAYFNDSRRAPRAVARVTGGVVAGLALWLVWGTPAQAQTSAETRQILERLNRLEEENRALAAEVRALRNELADTRAKEPAATPTTEERLSVQDSRIAEQAQTKVEASQRFPIRITGMALFNSYFNSKGSGGGEYPTVATPGREGSGGATLRQTILGLEYNGPRTFWNGSLHGTLRMDFFGGTGRLLDQTVRLRTASIGIDWKDRSLLAGLEKPIISPREPSSLAQVGVSPLTGAGNLWLWIPQIRIEQDFRFGEQAGVRAQVGVVQTREAPPDVASSYGAPTSYATQPEPARPGIEARVEFFGGSERRIEIAPGVHHSISHVGGASVPSNLFSIDWFVRPWKPVEFTGAIFAGQNAAPLGAGGSGPGLVLLGPGRVLAVHSHGGWAQLAYQASQRLSFHFYTGQQDNRNSDLQTGRIGKNLAYGANFFYHLAPNVLTSFEVSQVRTSYIGGDTVLNNHYDLSLAYLF